MQLFYDANNTIVNKYIFLTSNFQLLSNYLSNPKGFLQARIFTCKDFYK